jgi:hypothetical protein
MIIRYNSKTPGTPLRTWDIDRKSFEVVDFDGNHWQISDPNASTGLEITLVSVAEEPSQGGSVGLNVVPVSPRTVDVEFRS